MNYLNTELSIQEKSLGMAGSLQLEYNSPVNVPQNFSAVCPKTTQNNSSLSIQNLSASFSLTVYIDPAPLTGPSTITIAANNPTPFINVQNYNGAKLSISNISQEGATAKITLTDLS